GIPTIAVGHGLVFAGCALPSDLPAPSLWHQRANTVIPTTLAHFRVAVHFLPCRPSGAGVTVARPDLDPLLSAASSSDDGTIVGYFRFGRSRAVMAALRAEGLEVRAFGSGPGAARFDRAQFRSALRDCRAVVSNAGSNVLAECVALGKPVLAVYASDHHEQRLNASLVDAAQVGIGACLDTFETPETGRAVAERFARRLKTNDFAAVSLREALPPASAVVARLVTGVPVEV
ncbi:MAG: glycosyltransferase family protein, partial [Myxococcota bacterium]